MAERIDLKAVFDDTNAAIKNESNPKKGLN